MDTSCKLLKTAQLVHPQNRISIYSECTYSVNCCRESWAEKDMRRGHSTLARIKLLRRRYSFKWLHFRVAIGRYWQRIEQFYAFRLWIGGMGF